jgi:hypothetical protein
MGSRDLIKNSIISGLGTAGIMFVCYSLVFTLVSNTDEIFKQGWLIYGSNLDIRLFGNIPLTEMIWGFTMGFVIGPLYEFVHQKS